jgi:hypothetical protein
MPARFDAEPLTTVLLTIDTGSAVWALPSAAVTAIEPFTESDRETVADVGQLLGAAPVGASRTRRVLSVEVSGHRLRLLADGALMLRTIGQRELVPLPPALAGSSPFVTHVALVDGKPALLVVSPERLLLALHGAESLSSTTLAHRPETLPC